MFYNLKDKKIQLLKTKQLLKGTEFKVEAASENSVCFILPVSFVIFRT